jgi:transposase InsO family protein
VSRRKRPRTTQRREDARPAPDLVDRKFSAEAPDRLWVADITYLPSWAGFLYLAVVLDAFSRRVVGWAMVGHLRSQGISKAGNGLARRVMIQSAWLWVKHQPESELTKWFRRRTEGQSRRMRRVMIVALARKLAIALWRYLEHGLIPEGAILKAK